MKNNKQQKIKCSKCQELLQVLGELLYCYTDHHSQSGIEKDDKVGRLAMLNLALSRAYAVAEKTSGNLEKTLGENNEEQKIEKEDSEL